jgi:hypothetical protein
MRRCSLILICLLLLPSLAFCQSKVGQAGAQFLDMGVSARAVSMGQAFAAVSDDATAVLYNPAGLTQLDSREVMFTHMEYVADITYNFVALAYPLYSLGGTLGIGIYALDAGDMKVTSYERPTGYVDPITGDWYTFGAQDHALSISYARSLTDHFSIGVTWKVIDELYEEYRATGWAADIGTTYDTGYRGIKMSMVIANFGPEMRFISDEYPLPINFKFGGSANVIEGLNHRGTFAVEGSHPSDNYEQYTAGFEYSYDETYSIRAGQNFGKDSAAGFAVGGGINLALSDYGLSIDYGYHDYGVLKESHLFTVGFKF